MRHFILLSAMAVCAQSLDMTECSKLGFSSDTLACTSCDKLAAVLPDEALEAECRGCCRETNETGLGKFESGRLEVCK